MRPKFCCRMTFHAGRVTKNAPLRCTSTSGLSRSSVISSKSASLTVPALLTRMSTRPQVSTAVSMIAWPPSGRRNAVGVGDRLPAVVLDLLHGVIGGTAARTITGDRAAEVVDDDACTAFGEQKRVLPAQAPARAGDNGYLIVESQFGHQIGHSCRAWVNCMGTARGSRVGFEVDIASIISAT